MTTTIQPIVPMQNPNFRSPYDRRRTEHKNLQMKRTTEPSGVSFKEMLEQELRKVDLLA